MNGVRLLYAGICVPLGILVAIHFPAQMTRADAGVTGPERILVTSILTTLYLAIPLISIKSIRASSLVANVFCILVTPYVVILFLFSGWSMPSAEAAHWLLFVISGNTVLFVASVAGTILSFRKSA